NPGSLTGTQPSCTPIVCTAVAPADGTVDDTTLDFGQTAQFACNAGFELSGTATRTCGGVSNPGSLTGTQPSCTPIVCTALAPADGKGDDTTLHFGPTAQFPRHP